tara:strand:+ start:2860 stop:3126 length:267 start_codon:yes stop_codon:yes gene_type:complete
MHCLTRRGLVLVGSKLADKPKLASGFELILSYPNITEMQRNLPKWQTFGNIVSSNIVKSIGMTTEQLGLKTSVSARVPWVRIPPPPSF